MWQLRQSPSALQAFVHPDITLWFHDEAGYVTCGMVVKCLNFFEHFCTNHDKILTHNMPFVWCRFTFELWWFLVIFKCVFYYVCRISLEDADILQIANHSVIFFIYDSDKYKDFHFKYNICCHYDLQRKKRLSCNLRVLKLRNLCGSETNSD